MQQRVCWCRACGESGREPVGWSIVSAADYEALRDASRTPINGRPVGDGGRFVVRLRLRVLACRKCGTVGTLVAGARPRVVSLKAAERTEQLR